MDIRIARAVRLIERDMADPVRFDLIAAAVGLSSSRFHHLFRAETGAPPGAYLRRIRLDAAALRLQWTAEPAGRIAVGLGYDSQASFTHAFRRRFGVPPGDYRARYARSVAAPGAPRGCSRVTIREVPVFRLLARRYVGDLWEVRRFWTDFEARLPGGPARWRSGLFLGLLHDDPRTTPLGETRYDCCVTIPEAATLDPEEAARAGLQAIATRPGLYGGLSFAGPREEVLPAYRLLCDHWVRNSRFTITEDPAIEIHARPRHRMDPANLDLTILLALE